MLSLQAVHERHVRLRERVELERELRTLDGAGRRKLRLRAQLSPELLAVLAMFGECCQQCGLRSGVGHRRADSLSKRGQTIDVRLSGRESRGYTQDALDGGANLRLAQYRDDSIVDALRDAGFQVACRRRSDRLERGEMLTAARKRVEDLGA